MKKILFITLLISVGIVALEPFGIVMPTSAQMTAAGVLLALLIVSIGIVWQENPRDERESELFATRARGAYLAGLAVGSIGIAHGAFTHRVDWWLVAVIATMLTAKLFYKK